MRRRHGSIEQVIDLERARRERDDMLASASWRLTAPLRVSIDAFRRVVAVLAQAARRSSTSAGSRALPPGAGRTDTTR
jgi:hypothetical protein